MVYQRGPLLRGSLQAILLTLFLLFFGQPAIERYLERKTYVLSDVRPSSGIQSPSLTICPQDKVTGNAWKNGDKIQALKNKPNHNSFVNITEVCKGNYTKCVEEETYGLSEIVVKVRKGSGIESRDIEHEINWQESFSFYGRCFTFDYDHISGTNAFKDELLFYLNSTIDYTINVHDPNYIDLRFFNPLSVPSVQIGLKSEASKGIFYTIALTEVAELSVPQDPCDGDSGYSFQVTGHRLFVPLAPSRRVSGIASPHKLAVNLNGTVGVGQEMKFANLLTSSCK